MSVHERGFAVADGVEDVAYATFTSIDSPVDVGTAYIDWSYSPVAGAVSPPPTAWPFSFLLPSGHCHDEWQQSSLQLPTKQRLSSSSFDPLEGTVADGQQMSHSGVAERPSTNASLSSNPIVAHQAEAQCQLVVPVAPSSASASTTAAITARAAATQSSESRSASQLAACMLCRHAKVRCDGGRPCSRCVRLDRAALCEDFCRTKYRTQFQPPQRFKPSSLQQHQQQQEQQASSSRKRKLLTEPQSTAVAEVSRSNSRSRESAVLEQLRRVVDEIESRVHIAPTEWSERADEQRQLEEEKTRDREAVLERAAVQLQRLGRLCEQLQRVADTKDQCIQHLARRLHTTSSTEQLHTVLATRPSPSFVSRCLSSPAYLGSPLCLLLISRAGFLLDVNVQFLRSFGWQRHEVINRRICPRHIGYPVIPCSHTTMPPDNVSPVVCREKRLCQQYSSSKDEVHRLLRGERSKVEAPFKMYASSGVVVELMCSAWLERDDTAGGIDSGGFDNSNFVMASAWQDAVETDDKASTSAWIDEECLVNATHH